MLKAIKNSKMTKTMVKCKIMKTKKMKQIKNNRIWTTAKLFQQINTKRIMPNKDIKTKLKIIKYF